MNGPDPTAHTGTLAFSTPAERDHAAAEVAGALAELGVQTLHVSGPSRTPAELHARETDLPRTLATSPPGTAFAFADGLVRVEDRALVWLARGPAAERLQALSRG